MALGFAAQLALAATAPPPPSRAKEGYGRLAAGPEAGPALARWFAEQEPAQVRSPIELSQQ